MAFKCLCQSSCCTPIICYCIFYDLIGGPLGPVVDSWWRSCRMHDVLCLSVTGDHNQGGGAPAPSSCMLVQCPAAKPLLQTLNGGSPPVQWGSWAPAACMVTSGSCLEWVQAYQIVLPVLVDRRSLEFIGGGNAASRICAAGRLAVPSSGKCARPGGARAGWVGLLLWCYRAAALCWEPS